MGNKWVGTVTQGHTFRPSSTCGQKQDGGKRPVAGVGHMKKTRHAAKSKSRRHLVDVPCLETSEWAAGNHKQAAVKKILPWLVQAMQAIGKRLEKTLCNGWWGRDANE